MFTAQEILVGNADYPTEKIAETTPRVPPARPRLRQPRRHAHGAGPALRQRRRAGPGPPPSPSLMTGHAYATSARIASRMGPVRRLRRQRGAHAAGAAHAPRRRRADRRGAGAGAAARRRPARRGTTPSPAARSSACATARPRVLAPTGTIGLMMDCDTTGIEPDLGLVKIKKLVGGGTMSIVNQTVPRALRRLGYDARADRRHRRLHRRAQVDPRRAAPAPGAPAGVRLLDGRQRHPLRGPHPDDGGRAAVHLRRDLQDGQHARGGHGRGRRGAPPAVVEARPEGRRHLPRQLQGRPAAVDDQEGRHRGCRAEAADAGRRARRGGAPPAGPREAAPQPAVAARSSSGWPTARAS